ncbi:MAG: S-methyl-5'-thioadenosine phosphorylase [Actinomycetia bacterium]|nr:S-methyl-5'-thioadenosine phosphorylase [Actinomycetes bacterium]
MAKADIGIIGGSGFYSLLEDAEAVAVPTPFGAPSGEPTVGLLAGRRVAFLPRHGVDHRFAPHVVPYRANLWALRALGARQVVALSAVGSLRAEHGAGTLVVADQIIDRTHGRAATFVADGAGVTHVPFADPYCPVGRAAAVAGAAALGLPVVDEATMVVINGPRFSTRAESRAWQRDGGTIVGMTGMPEAVLARELELCYTALSLVTDLDAGVEAGEGVTHGEVLEQFAANLPRLRELLVATVERLPAAPGEVCGCGDLYAQAPAPFELP